MTSTSSASSCPCASDGRVSEPHVAAPPCASSAWPSAHFRNLAEVDLDAGAALQRAPWRQRPGKSNLLEAIHYLGRAQELPGGAHRRPDRARSTRGAARGAVRRRAGARSPRRSGSTARAGAQARRSTKAAPLHRGLARARSRWSCSTRATCRWRAARPRRGARFSTASSSRSTRPTRGRWPSYQKALRSRNRLLKREDADRRSILAYDELLASAGAVVGRSARALARGAQAARARPRFRRVAGEELP